MRGAAAPKPAWDGPVARDRRRGRGGSLEAVTELEPSAFLRALPLPRHRAYLERLVAAAMADPRLRFVELSCSVARGAGDDLSDLDVGVGVADGAWPAALDALEPLARSLGEAVGVLEHTIPEWGDRPHRRLFAQYADGIQLDLVAMPASSRRGLPPGAIALYDPDRQLATRVEPAVLRATPGDLREWAFLAWAALADLDKYLRRESVWEAFERLHAARTLLWRLWAAECSLPYPAFGLTAVLDAAPPRLPPRIEATVAALEPGDLRRAAIDLAELLAVISREAARGAGPTAAMPDGMAGYVLARLRGG